MVDLSASVKAAVRALQKWLWFLRLRFERNFDFVFSKHFGDLANFTRTALQTTNSLFRLSAQFVRKHVIKSKNSESLLVKQSIDEYKISPPNRKLSFNSQTRESNFGLFERFVAEFYLNEAPAQATTDNSELPEYLQETLRRMKGASSERALVEVLEGLEARLKMTIGEMSRERGLVDSEMLLQEKTVSYKRINQTKLSESKEIHAVERTIDKLHYGPENHSEAIGENLNKLKINSGDELERSISSNQIDQDQFKKGEKIRQSQIQVENLEPNSAPANKDNLKFQFGRSETISNPKSSVKNPFKSLIKKRNLMTYSQNFQMMKDSRESMGLSGSKLMGKVDSQLYSDAKESPQLIIQKKVHRKLMIDFPFEQDLNWSRKLQQDRGNSFHLRNTIESKDLGSIEQTARNNMNPFVFTSNLTIRNKSPELSKLNNHSIDKFRTGQHNPKKTTALYKGKKDRKRKKKAGINHVKKRKSSALEQIIKGHQKFNSVNLEYLMLKNTGRLSTFQNSQMTNIAEESSRGDIITKQKFSGRNNQRADSHVSNMVRMKSMVAKNSSQKYNNMMSSYLAKAKANRARKPKKKMRGEQPRTLQSDPFKTSGAQPKSMKTKKKPSTSKLFDRRNTININNSRASKKILKERSVRVIPGLRTVNKRRTNEFRNTSKKNRNQLRSIQVAHKRRPKQENKKLFANKKTTQSQLEPGQAKKGALIKKIKNLSYYLGKKNVTEKKKPKNLSKNYKKAYRLKIKKKETNAQSRREKEAPKNSSSMNKNSSSITKKLKSKFLVNSGELQNMRGMPYKNYCPQLGNLEPRLKKQRRQRERKKPQNEAKKSQFI